ncbi:MAG: site-specific integrase [Cellvibrionales bacterium]|nr:site-specific integrase [Cellvibrionales bacterium]
MQWPLAERSVIALSISEVLWLLQSLSIEPLLPILLNWVGFWLPLRNLMEPQWSRQHSNSRPCYSSAQVRSGLWNGRKLTGSRKDGNTRFKNEDGKPHIVPLSRQAIDILRDIHKETGRSSYVFPVGKKFSKPLSENGVRTALRNMGFGNEEVSPHGFRATARTILDEVLEFRVDLIEHQLAHAVKDPTGRAYNRTSHLPARKEMMQRWA